MKSMKELIERLQTEEAFVQTVNEAMQAAEKDGEKDPVKLLVIAAGELGYEATEEQIREMQIHQTTELDDEELGKVAGGTSPVFLFSTLALMPIVSPTIIVTVDNALSD